MGEYELAYGTRKMRFQLDDALDATIIVPAEIPETPDPTKELRFSLSHPVDDTSLTDFSDAKSVAIAINDKTRPVPHQYILPVLTQHLIDSGISPEAIQLFIATGTHPPLLADEFHRIMPEEIYTRFQVISHDCDDEQNLIDLGTTNRGTPVRVNKKYYEADLKIVVGNIEPHHFMGFSGGVKSAAIGLASRDTINKNHAFLIDPACVVGTYETNPMRMDIEEIGKKIGIHFALNVILNEDKKIIKSFAGKPKNVIRGGIPFSRKICQVEVPGKFDLVIASVGGAPKDINLYQAQKAMTHAALITKDHGTVILVAECAEGIGNASFVKFMSDIQTPDEVFQKFEKMGFQIGPHKAFQIARQAARIQIYLVSDIERKAVAKTMLHPADSIEEALILAFANFDHSPRIAIMPRAINTIPFIEN